MGQPLLNVVHQLRSMVGRADDQQADGELLRRFIQKQDEQAFLMLMRRHGPMVLGVCRRASLSEHDAEDAYQAVFIVLVRRASSLDGSGSLANWLYGVAWKTAVKARSRSLKRRDREKVVQEIEATVNDETPKSQWSDLKPLLDEEVSSLPEKYRTPFVLCYLQGKTNAEAASEMGCPQGTVFTRLSRARDMLRAKLERRGIALSAAGMAAALVPSNVSASVPASLTANMVLRDGALLAGEAVQALAETVVQDLMWPRIRTVAAVLLAMGLTGTGVAWAMNMREAPVQPPPASGNSQVVEPRPELLQLGKPQLRADKDVLSVVYTHDGKTVLSAGADGVIREWNTRTGRETRQFKGHGKGVLAVALSPDGTLLASTSHDGTLRFWDMATGKELRRLDTMGDLAVAFAPDGKTLATASSDQHVQFWDVASGKKLDALEQAQGTIWNLSFSPNKKWLAACSFDPILTPEGPPLPEGIESVEPSIQILDLASRKSRFEFKIEAMYLAFSPDSRTLLSTNPGTSAYLWEMATGQVRCRLPDSKHLTRSAAFSPDGRRLAMSDGNNVTVWDARTGARTHVFSRHQAGVNCVAFAPDGKSLASGSSDSTTILWDLPPLEIDVNPRTPAQLESLWADLGRASAETAFAAIGQLSRDPGAGDFVARRLQYPKPIDINDEQLKTWIKDLDHDEFAVRDRADVSLKACGPAIQAKIRDVLKTDLSTEQRRRLESMLGSWQQCAYTPAELQLFRALEVLENIGTPQARDAIEKFSRDAGPLQDEAKAAVTRLSKKS